MNLESSFELIQRAQAGDGDALNRLLARYRPRLERWATGRLPRSAGSMLDTGDLVQEALISTIRHLPRFEDRGEGALQAYLRQTVTNKIRDELRSVSRRPKRQALSDSLPSVDASPLEIALGAETFARYESGLAVLDGDEREAVIARLELGCSYQEIAQLAKRPTADAARMFVARALEKLARSMAGTA